MIRPKKDIREGDLVRSSWDGSLGIVIYMFFDPRTVEVLWETGILSRPFIESLWIIGRPV